MNTHTTRIGLVAAVIAGGLALSGCVSTDTFNAHVDASNASHAALGSRLDALDGKVAANAQAAAAAQSTADAALKGKFLMTEVGRESVNFNTGQSTLSDEAKATLTALADRLKSENKNVYLEVRGYTDMRGGKLANRQLGRERAANTARFLVDQGVPGNKIQVGSWGEDVPVAGKEDSLAENRRVEIVIVQ
jgi:peptidoglycan-associated lipoprotein